MVISWQAICLHGPLGSPMHLFSPMPFTRLNPCPHCQPYLNGLPQILSWLMIMRWLHTSKSNLSSWLSDLHSMDFGFHSFQKAILMYPPTSSTVHIPSHNTSS